MKYRVNEDGDNFIVFNLDYVNDKRDYDFHTRLLASLYKYFKKNLLKVEDSYNFTERELTDLFNLATESIAFEVNSFKQQFDSDDMLEVLDSIADAFDMTESFKNLLDYFSNFFEFDGIIVNVPQGIEDNRLNIWDIE